jgi:threonine/homoserine/homoserine lactone efflux protein
MEALQLLMRGAAAGLAIAAPVGPVNVLCVSRTLTKGWFSGFISGVGAAAADTLYGSVAGFSISIVISFLIREQNKLRFFGGILLILIGIWYWFKRPDLLSTRGRAKDPHSDFVSTFLLNLTNPTTVLSFLAVLAVLGLSEHRAAWLTLIMIGGIFAGSMIWWLILIGITHHFREKFDDRALFRMNRIAGFLIGAFGIVMLCLGASGHRTE